LYFHPFNYSAWQVIVDILKTDLTKDIIVDIGMPVLYNTVRYNCRVFILNSEILLIRPKLYLANDGNYRETRWFTEWKHHQKIETFTLPRKIKAIKGQKTCPIGDGVLRLNDTTLAAETCEELFTPDSPHIKLGLDGVEIVTNGSGSHHQLRKLNTRFDLIRSATTKLGGAYLYANQQGCDGGRLYYDGSAMIWINGKLLAQGQQFSLQDVEVIKATIDLDEIKNYRNLTSSRAVQSSEISGFPRIYVDFEMVSGGLSPLFKLSKPIEPVYLRPEEEIALGPACWLWDYLRRSKQGGFFLPLSGGIDSGATAAIVGSMCAIVYKDFKAGDENVRRDLRALCGKPEDWVPESRKEIANLLFFTCYMGTKNSSSETRSRAKRLAEDIGSYHYDIDIDVVIEALLKLFVDTTGKTPKFKVQGGTNSEDLALQNIQARSRMVISYFFAQTLIWVRDGGSKQLLVLGSANVDEGLRGYYTKYDCSSADINPIGSISKVDLKRFLIWGSEHLGFKTLMEIGESNATAELQPILEEKKQVSEDDMGMTFKELSYYGILRKMFGCGPVGMFNRLVHEWTDVPVRSVGEKVKLFFKFYSINRHKMTTLTPSYHCESYSPDDNRFDLRQFLYNVGWTFQFDKIDTLVVRYEGEEKEIARHSLELSDRKKL
jgi:NAD+ synthase (glutamine-hydrolysing)